MAICSRVLECFGVLFALRVVSCCVPCFDWLKWLLRQPYLVTNLLCGMTLLITYSSSYTSSACGGADGLRLRCLPAIWLTLIVTCAKRSSHLVSRALYVLLDRLRLISGSSAWWSLNNFIGLPYI